MSRASWWQEARVLVPDALASLLLRPWHAMAMMSGIALAVASAVGAVVVADTQQAQVDLRFDLQRSDHAVVRAQSPTAAGFPAAQVRRIGQLEPVSAVGELSLWSDGEPVTRSVDDTTVSAPVVVADPGGLAASGTRVTDGAPTQLMSGTRAAPVVWVGAGLARDLHVGPADGTSDGDAQVVVGGHPFSVAGTLTNGSGFDYLDHAVVMSRPAALASLGGTGRTIRLVAHVRPGAATAVAEYAVRAADPDGELSLVDVTPADGERLVRDVGSDLRRVGAALGAFVGVIGMVAVANTLLMSVQQRMRELGLRSAIGWSRRRIGLLVLAESGVAGLVASVLGAAVGLLVAAVWCWTHGWTLVLSPSLPPVAAVVGVGASLVGGLVPAVRAASISPLSAMRS